MNWLESKACDLLVVVAFGMILPVSWLAAPRVAPINVHASLLPRWRGAAPIQRAIMAGDTETGVAIMRMEEGLDSGPVLTVERVPITPEQDEHRFVGRSFVVAIKLARIAFRAHSLFSYLDLGFIERIRAEPGREAR